MSAVKLKVCGITCLEDALLAIDCGADYLGFNFYAKSPRYVSPATARAIIQRTETRAVPVGVFVNEPVVEVLRLMEVSGVRLAQLHGHEDATFSETVGSERVIKVIRPLFDFEIATVMSFPAAIFLVDASNEKLFGGTGHTANWTIAAELALLHPTFLAGGIGPANVREAIAQVKPFGIDVNSAVESEPGRKDRERLELLRLEMNR